MNKEQAIKKLATVEEEVSKLRKIIETPEDYISLNVDTYEKVCKELGEKELTINDFNHLPEYLRNKSLIICKLNQIGKLFNGDWKVNISDKNQQKYYPYFEIKAGFGMVFYNSSYSYSCLSGRLDYFKDEKTAIFVGKNFINLYKEYYF